MIIYYIDEYNTYMYNMQMYIMLYMHAYIICGQRVSVHTDAAMSMANAAVLQRREWVFYHSLIKYNFNIFWLGLDFNYTYSHIYIYVNGIMSASPVTWIRLWCVFHNKHIICNVCNIYMAGVENGSRSFILNRRQWMEPFHTMMLAVQETRLHIS